MSGETSVVGLRVGWKSNKRQAVWAFAIFTLAGYRTLARYLGQAVYWKGFRW